MLRLKLGLRKLETERYAFARGIHLHIQYERHKAVLEKGKSARTQAPAKTRESRPYHKIKRLLQQSQPFQGIGNCCWVALFVYLNNFWPIHFDG